MTKHDGHQCIKCFISIIIYIHTIDTFSFLSLNLILPLGRALNNCKSIETFVLHYKDIQPFKLSEDEWNTVTLVTAWLKSFWSATTQMSATKTPMLSTMHAIFYGLQGDVQDILHSLLDTTAPELKKGDSPMHISSSVIIITSLMNHPTTYGLHASIFCISTCFRGPSQSAAFTSPVLFFYCIQIQYNSQAVTVFDSLVKKFNGARGKRRWGQRTQR